MKMLSIRTRSRGFTLLELMITIIIAAILVAIAVPGFQGFIKRNAVTSTANSLLADLQYARGEAVSRRAVTIVCPGTTATGCATGKDWYVNGWFAYRETAPGASASFSSTDDESMRSSKVSSANVSVQAADSYTCSGSSGTRNGAICFDQAGSSLDSGVVTLLVCAKADSGDGIGESTGKIPGNRIVVSPSGRAAIQKMAPGDDCK